MHSAAMDFHTGHGKTAIPELQKLKNKDEVEANLGFMEWSLSQTNEMMLLVLVLPKRTKSQKIMIKIVHMYGYLALNIL